MTTLNLSPLPSLRSDGASSVPDFGDQDFVDEAVVMALMADPIASRERVFERSEWVLPADEMDFAGWRLSPVPVARDASPIISPPPAHAAARPTPPGLRELGIGEPHQGSHRWWLAGLAGAVFTLLVTSLLLYLSSRISPQTEDSFMTGFTTRPRPPVSVWQTAPNSADPQLTDVSHERLVIDP